VTSLPPLALRPYLAATDDPLVYSSWIQQVNDVPPLAGTDPRGHRAVVTALLARAGATVACNPGAPDQIYGYVCAETPDVLHFVYVRNTWRRFGIGSLLLASVLPCFKREPIFATHATRALRHLRGPWRLEFNPYRVLQP
jgi:GNAT superfamily N-acetyltransferase